MNSFTLRVGPVPTSVIEEAIQRLQSDPSTGAVLSFSGVVRADNKGTTDVVSIRYSAYEEMAIELGTALTHEIQKKYALRALEVHHSIGLVACNECSLCVLCAGVHRKEAFAAMMELIDRIKSELPIWGKENLRDGTALNKKSEMQNVSIDKFGSKERGVNE